jgi:hypothetical protein
MTLPNKISLFTDKKYFFTILFCVFGTSVLFAQAEKERVFPDLPKHQDGVGSNEMTDPGFYENRGDYSNRLQPSKNTAPSGLLRKENPIFKQGGDKENKKEGMSTLSFNLFLYIVDRFKEDL